MGEDFNEQDLGKAIQKARQSCGLTQQDLCNKANLSYSTLAKIERGAIKTPSVFTVARVASVLGVSLDELLGLVGSARTHQSSKMTTSTGISFLFVDINGCLVHFFHHAFYKMSTDLGISSDVIETAFWHYNDLACRGEMTMDQFNQAFAKHIGVESVDWNSYYLGSIEKIQPMYDLVKRASTRFRIGLLSNIMPGQIDLMLAADILPNIEYDVIVDSSKLKLIKPDPQIYQKATELAGVDADSVLFVDDSRTNLMSAEQMGWRVMWFDDLNPEESTARIEEALEIT